MVRPGFVVTALVAFATSAGAASDLPRRIGMYAPQGSALAMVDSKIVVRMRGPIAETLVTQTFRNDTDRVTEATYIFPLPADAAVSAMEIETGTRTIRAAIESRDQAQQRYERAVAAGVGAALLDQERPDVFTQTVSAIAARGTVTITLRVDTVARFQNGHWELVLPLVVAPRYVPGTASGRPTTGTGRAPDTDRAPDASRITPAGAPGAGGKTNVTIEFADAIEDVTSPTHELTNARNRVSFTDPKTDHDAVIRWRAKVPTAGWVEAGDDGGFAALVVQAPAAAARKLAVRVQLLLDRSATTRGDADTIRRPFVRALLAAMTNKDAVALGGDKVEFRAPDLVQRALDDSWSKSGGPFDLTKVLAQTRNQGAIVLVTDGLVADDRAVVAAATKLGAPIHVIGIGPAPNRSLLAAIAVATGGTIRFAIAGDDLSALARDVLADAAAPPEPLKITWGALKPTEVVPATLPRLGAGQATLVIAKVKRAQPANARVYNDVVGFASVTPARAPDGATTTRGSLARRWAKLRLDELVVAGNTRAVTEHALRYGLVSPMTSMVAIGDDVVVKGGVKHSVPVAVSVPEGMQWQLVKREIAVDSKLLERREDKNAKDGKSEHTKLSGNYKDKKKSAPDPKPEPPRQAPVAPAKPPAAKPPTTTTKTPQASPAPTMRPPTEPAPQPAPTARDYEAEEDAPAAKVDMGADRAPSMEPRGGGATATGSSYEPADEDSDDGELVLQSSSPRRALRFSLGAGAGIAVVNGEAGALGALSGRLELGRRTRVGGEASLWLVDGLNAQGSILGTLTQRIVRRLEVGIGAGLRITGDSIGPAWDLTLRTPLTRRVSPYLRYDGALLFREGTYDGQNAGSVGLEATF